MSPSSLLPAAAALPCTLCFKPRAQPRSSFTLSTCSCFSSSTTFCKHRGKGERQPRQKGSPKGEQHPGGDVGTEPRGVPGPHLLLLQAPQRVADVLHVLGGQGHQGCVASPQIHELPRDTGENRGEKGGAISAAGGPRVSPFTVHEMDEAPAAWEPPKAPGRAWDGTNGMQQVCRGGWWPQQGMLHDTGVRGHSSHGHWGGCSTLNRGLPASFISTQSRQDLGSLQGGSHPKDAHTATLHGALVIYLARLKG